MLSGILHRTQAKGYEKFLPGRGVVVVIFSLVVVAAAAIFLAIIDAAVFGDQLQTIFAADGSLVH
uniref:Uncharacterized protein n=1 Tax=Romanomermis culicivorax TaxID=13658 RepID=A0A915J3K0_ROMCU